MQTSLTSRERILGAIHRQPVDHIPLLLRFWWIGGEEDCIPFKWWDQLERVEHTLALGLDDTLLLEPPFGYTENYCPERVPGVSSRIEVLPALPDEHSPRLVKTYQTPEGVLQTSVVKTDDWPNGDEIHLFDDYNLSRLKEPLIKSAADLSCLRHLLYEPSPEQLQAFQDQACELASQAGRLGVALDGGWSALGDAAAWLVGIDRILYSQLDEPGFIDALLQVIFDWELRRMEQTIDLGVDVWVHMAWYEGTDFWSPRSFRRFIKPRLAKLVDCAHAHGVAFRYIITRGWKPLARDLLEIGVDCLAGVDPVQDRVTLEEARDLLGGRMCLMGGINSATMLSQATEEEIRQAVTRAVDVLAPSGGFILYPVDAIFNNQPWERVQVIIDQWKKLC
jgi:Uroporphyrinogen decarboxylase (URO-D)